MEYKIVETEGKASIHAELIGVEVYIEERKSLGTHPSQP